MVDRRNMEKLHDLLADGIRYDPRYLPSLNSDHMPMTLCAISALGGDDEACIAFRDDYKKILREITPSAPPVNWRDGNGQTKMYPSLLSFFKEQVFKHGIETTVAKFLPEFICSTAMDAIHHTIRLGFSLYSPLQFNQQRQKLSS